jgi:flagellar biosynthesis repressor protein FlbT
MPLKLSLKPNEKIVLNGAVVQNGDRRTTLLLQNKASVLREKDIMQIEDANTPVRRMTEFMSVVRLPNVLEECVGMSREVMSGEYYKALSRCRKLMDYEAERLGDEGDLDVAGSISDSSTQSRNAA